MKVLSIPDVRLQDRLDGVRLLQLVSNLDLHRMRANLRSISERGFDRGQDLSSKLESLLAAVNTEP
jgi:hypothetical protein